MYTQLNDRREINARCTYLLFFFQTSGRPGNHHEEWSTSRERSKNSGNITADLFSRSEDCVICWRGPWEKSSCTRWMTTAHKEIATEWRKAGERASERTHVQVREQNIQIPFPRRAHHYFPFPQWHVTDAPWRLLSTDLPGLPTMRVGRQRRWIRWRISCLSISRKHNGRQRIIENGRGKWTPYCFRRNAGNTSSRCK